MDQTAEGGVERIDLSRPRVDRRRVHLSIREDETDVLRWLAVQANKSASIICLIKRAIDRRGYTDVTVSNVTGRVRRTRAQIVEDERDARIKEMAARSTGVPAVPQAPVPARPDEVLRADADVPADVPAGPVTDADEGTDAPPALSMKSVRTSHASRADNAMSSLMDNI